LPIYGSLSAFNNLPNAEVAVQREARGEISIYVAGFACDTPIGRVEQAELSEDGHCLIYEDNV
jgi:hypothetical protein